MLKVEPVSKVNPNSHQQQQCERKKKRVKLIGFGEILSSEIKRQGVGKARSIEELEMIAIKRGYSMRWVSHMAKAKGIR